MLHVHRFILFTICFPLAVSYALSPSGVQYLKNFLTEREYYTQSNLQYLLKGRVISNSNVKTIEDGKEQVVWTKIAGLHSDRCEQILPKISRYEDYSKYMSFMDLSSYNNGIVQVRLKISLLPVTFSAAIKIDRIAKPGEYPFTMTAGILKDAKGLIKVEEKEGRCFLYTKFDQRGPHLGYSDFIMENFFTTVGKLGLEKLFMLTGHRADV